jgi:hypothetical protein
MSPEPISNKVVGSGIGLVVSNVIDDPVLLLSTQIDIAGHVNVAVVPGGVPDPSLFVRVKVVGVLPGLNITSISAELELLLLVFED